MSCNREQEELSMPAKKQHGRPKRVKISYRHIPRAKEFTWMWVMKQVGHPLPVFPTRYGRKSARRHNSK